MSFTIETKLVATKDYLTIVMHNYLIYEQNAHYKRTACADDYCDCLIDVYEFDVNSKCEDEFLKNLQTIMEHSKGNLRMYVFVPEVDAEQVQLIESFELKTGLKGA